MMLARTLAKEDSRYDPNATHMMQSVEVQHALLTRCKFGPKLERELVFLLFLYGSPVIISNF